LAVRLEIGRITGRSQDIEGIRHLHGIIDGLGDVLERTPEMALQDIKRSGASEGEAQIGYPGP